MKLFSQFTVFGLFFLFVSFPLNANAQAARTWVSGVGDDVNPCSRTAPCKTFAGAISKTAASGEINVIDPGGYGAVTITKSITIRSDHIEAGVLVSQTNGIVVAAGAGDQVVLDGLDIDGDGATGLDGLKITSGKVTYLIRSAIRRFGQNGVNMISSTPGSRLVIKDSDISMNNTGVNVQGNGNTAVILNSLIDSNSAWGVKAVGSGNAVSIAKSEIGNSPYVLTATGGAAITSIGPSNVILGNGVFSNTLPYK